MRTARSRRPCPSGGPRSRPRRRPRPRRRWRPSRWDRSRSIHRWRLRTWARRGFGADRTGSRRGRPPHAGAGRARAEGSRREGGAWRFARPLCYKPLAKKSCEAEAALRSCDGRRSPKGAQQGLRAVGGRSDVVSPQAARGILLALLVLAPALALPGPARADDPFCDQQEQAYDAAQSNGAGATPPYCRSPDLFGANLAATVTDERFPSQMCGYAANVAQDSATKSPFYVQLVLDGLPESSLQVLKLLHTGDFSDELCWNATLAAGWHRFSLTVDPPRGDAPNGDVAESDESNNVAPDRWFYVRPTPAPDLHLAAFRVSPPVGRPSTSQFMVATVANAGDAP